MKHAWVNRFVIVTLVGGLCLASYGLGVTPAAAAGKDKDSGNPFGVILDKLDEIQTAISGIGSGGPVDLCYGGTTVGRFVVNGTEVCDRTTGLTWQRNPDAIGRTHAAALIYCPTVGPHYRLPEVKELFSLVDYTQFAPSLPAGNPFTNIQSPWVYWSTTTLAQLLTNAWFVQFGTGGVVSTDDKASPYYAWCVR